MKKNSFKNRKLLKQYPFLTEILSEPLKPLDGRGGTVIDDLVIRVERADGNLMYRQADNTGFGDGSYCFSLQDVHDDQIMRRGEYFFAVDGSNRIINRVVWPLNAKERKASKRRNIYGREIFWNPNPYQTILGKVEYLVWITVEAWHQSVKDKEGSKDFGEFRSRSVEAVVYLKPKDRDFQKIYEQASVSENLCLNSQMILQAALSNDSEIKAALIRLEEICRFFQDDVYDNGLKDILSAGRCPSFSGHLGPSKVMTFQTCGYTRVFLRNRDGIWISFQLRSEAQTMYVLNMCGTLPELRRLIRDTARAWQNPENRANLVPDNSVSIFSPSEDRFQAILF